jgi:hypothetical protein
MLSSLSNLSDFLFPAPARRSTAAILAWWEARRLHYNLFVGTAGAFSLCVMAVLSWIPPYARPLQPQILLGAAVFGVLANLFYLMGPAAELLLERIWGRKLLPAGPTLFRMGLTFSVGLAMLPAMVSFLDFGIRIVRWLF